MRTVGTPRPIRIVASSISGTPALGNVMTWNPGAWINGPTISLQWIRDANTVIGGATGATYTLQAADQTHTVKVRVTATNIYDTVTVDTPSSATVS
jgi:hypothetical protein